jgi:hypothetical protein
MSDTVTSTGGSSRRRRTWVTTQPTTRPIATPPTALRAKLTTASLAEKTPVSTAAMAKRYAIRAVASLMRLSPSITATSVRGAPTRRAIAVAAIGSVGETIAPRTNATGQSRPIAACATTATASIVASTRPIERNPIGLMFRRSSRSDPKNAAE